jgi:hypothetical protein
MLFNFLGFYHKKNTFNRSNPTKISKYLHRHCLYSHAQMDNRAISSISQFDGARVSTGSLKILIMDMNGGVGVYID